MRSFNHRYAVLLVSGLMFTACSLGSETKYSPPVNFAEVQNCNGADVKISHLVDPNTQGVLLQFFAEEIQPILEGRIPVDPFHPEDTTGQIACIGCHRENNFATAIGFKAAGEKLTGLDPNTQFNYNQFLCSAQLNFQDPAGSRILMKLRGKEGYDTSDEAFPPLPGLHHMDNTYVIGQGTIYQAFKQWVALEASLRTNEDLGLRSVKNGGISQLCWIEQPRNAFRPGGDRIAGGGGENPLLMCQAINEQHVLQGSPVDVTAMVQPPLVAPYNLHGLIVNRGEDDVYKIFVGISEAGNPSNVAEIKLTFPEKETETTNGNTGGGVVAALTAAVTEEKKSYENKLTGAERRYIVDPEYQTGCKTFRMNELGEMAGRCSNAYPTAYAFGRVFFESNQPIQEYDRVTPEYPDPTDPTKENPAIPLDKTVNGADAYHGGEIAKNSFSVGEDGLPRIFIASHWHRQEHAVISLGGKFAINGWENKKHGGRWMSKGPADWRYGSTIDVEAPVMGLSTPLRSVAESDLPAKMVFANSGPLVMGLKAGGVETGGVVQVAYHERGGFAFDSTGALPPDRAPPIQNPIENFTDMGFPCDSSIDPLGQENEFILDGVYGMPALDPSGSALFVTGTEEMFDTCFPEDVPTNIGIWWMTLNGNQAPVLYPLPPKTYFSNGYFIADVAWVGKQQMQLEFIPKEVPEEDLKVATIHIPNVANYLAMKEFSNRDMNAIIDEFGADSSPYKVKKVAVFRNYNNPPSHVDTSIVSDCRGCGRHPSFAGTEFASNGQLICKIPLKADGSWAAKIPARMGYSLMFLAEVETPMGIIDVPVRQDPLRVSKPGMQEFQAARTKAELFDTCLACHNSSKTIKDTILSHDGTTEFDRSNTDAMNEEIADCYTNPMGDYADYEHDIKPLIEAKSCRDCHNSASHTFTDVDGVTHEFNDVSPAGGLNFEPTWANTNDPTVSSRYTHSYGQGDHCPVGTAQRADPDDTSQMQSLYVCIPCGEIYHGTAGDELIVCNAHGENSPFEPGYVMLERASSADENAGLPVYLGWYSVRGASTDARPSMPGLCGSFLRTVYGDITPSGSCNNYAGWDGQPWLHPDDRYPTLVNPVSGQPYHHRGQFTLEEAQVFMDAVTTGWGFNRAPDQIMAPAASAYAGQTRWGLAPEP